MRRRSPFALVLVAIMLMGTPTFGQSTASIAGFVSDAATGETLILANVSLSGTTLGTATNTTGFYTISSIPPGQYELVASYIGYTPTVLTIELSAGEQRRINLELRPSGTELEEVVVSADRAEDEEIRAVGAAQLNTQIIRQLPAVLEPDVFRSLQLLPGVKSASDFSSGLYIRGGSPDQTLILLDRTSVYNPTHFFGFFSTFNPDAIKDVRLYKGGYPANYGGRLGAVVDIYNKDGNRVERKAGLSVGLLAARAYVEGPYEKGSYMFAIRRSTLEPLLAALNNADIDGLPESFYFYDANGKINYDASESDRLSLSFYAGTDDLKLPFQTDALVMLNYGNRTISANWTHIFSNQLFSNFTFTRSHYFSKPEVEIAATPIEQNNDVWDISAKGDLEYLPSDRHSLTAGFWTGNLILRLGSSFDGQETLDSRTQAFYNDVYIQHAYTPTSRWKIQYGLRAGYFSGGRYWSIDPRISLEHRPTADVRLQLGYGRYHQNLTLITNETFSGFDLWLTADEGVAPSWGDQFVAGVKTNLPGGIQLDMEGYYRTMFDLFDLDPFIGDQAGFAYEELFQFGEGTAYGAEIFMAKPTGRLNGFLAYTWSNTTRQYDGFEGDKVFSPKFDRTHEINLVANVNLSDRWQVTSAFNFGTGQVYTEPAQQYRFTDSPFTVDPDGEGFLVSPFNEARLPDYHRLDIGFLRKRERERFETEWQFQLVNVYGRQNVWFYFFDTDDIENVKRTTIPMLPVPIPNIAVTIRF
jgi:hypothetical protein